MKRLVLLVSAIALLGASAQAQTPPAAPVLLGAGDPSPFASGSWPAGSSDTGVAGCPALTPTAGFTAGTNGATYQNLDVSGQIVVNASNVTFHCVRLRAPGYRYGFQINSTADRTLLENVDVANASDSTAGSTGQGKCILVYGTNTTIRRANVSDCEDGIHVSSPGPTLVEWSYIHDMKTSGTNLHADAVQAVSGGNLTLRYNRIVPQATAGAGVNSAVELESYSTQLKNVELGSNLLGGGTFVLYIFADVYNGSQQPCPSGTNIHDNQWLKGIYQYGYITYGSGCAPTQNGGAFANNTVSDGTVLSEQGSSTTTPSSPVATLSLSPASLSATTAAGTTPQSGGLTIQNTGDAGSTLSWTVSESVSWLSVTPTSGTTTTETDSLPVTYKTAGLAAGTYTGTITVAAGTSSQKSIPVTLTLTTPASTGGSGSSTGGSTTGSTTGQQWPSGSSDTGLNAALPDLGGRTCVQYCAGSFPAYPTPPGELYPASGATIECKTITQKIHIKNPNVTLRCNDISSPGDNVANILIESASATNFLIEGNKIHDGYGNNPNCGVHNIVLYDGYGTIQYNDMYHGDTGLFTATPSSTPASIFQWNYWHDSIGTMTCPSSHTQAIHCEGNHCPKTLHNRLIHSTAAQNYEGTATYYSETSTFGGGPVLDEEIRFNLLEGGTYILRPDGHNARIEDNTLVTGGWIYGAFAWGGSTPSTFLRNVCDNGHALSLTDGGAKACTH